MRSGVLVLALCACGQVNKAPPDARPQDAFEPDSPPACAAGEMSCGGSCVDVMASANHCGSCTATCLPSQSCVAGGCVEHLCARVRQMDATAADGLYPNPDVGATGNIYCDFTNGKTYLDFTLDAINTPPPGYFTLRSTDLAQPAFAKAFIAFFNANHGVIANRDFAAGNCCLSTISNSRLQLAAAFTFAAAPATQSCAFAYVKGTAYTLSRTQGNGFIDQLPATYFTDFPPSEAAGCSEGTNPTFFYRRLDSLND